MKRAHLDSSLEPLEPRIAPATIMVTNINDSGAGSLRDAITMANLTATPDTILIKATGVVFLLGGQMDVTAPVTIKGPGAGKFLLNGRDASRIFFVSDNDTNKESLFALSGVSLVDGNPGSVSGGAILSTESVTLTSVVLGSNQASNGGALCVDGSAKTKVAITGCTFSANTATGQGGGVQIQASAGTTITKSVFNANSAGQDGGGAYLTLDSAPAPGARITVTGSSFVANKTSLGGGGLIILGDSAPASITSSVFTANSSIFPGGGLFSVDALLSVTGTIFSKNAAGSMSAISAGGGVYLGANTAKFTKVQMLGNSATNHGGALFFDAASPTGTMTFSGLVDGNTAGKAGGRILRRGRRHHGPARRHLFGQ